MGLLSKLSVFVTDFGVVEATHEPEAHAAWAAAPKRKDGQPDRRYKLGKGAWGAFKGVTERAMHQYLKNGD